MLARSLIISQLVELALYSGLWRWGLGPGPLWHLVVAVLGTYLGVRLLFIAATFGISWMYRSAAPPEGRVGVAGALGLWVRETAAAVALYGFFHPAERWLRPALPAAPPASGQDGVAVLLLHGFLCNGGFWWRIRRALARAGVDHVYTLNTEPPFGSISGFARQTSEAVEKLRRVTGRSRIVLVTHSMGGLVARRMRELNLSQDAVAGLITLGTPHHGTRHAHILAGVSVRQMRCHLPVVKEIPRNPWLERLNLHEHEPLPYPVVSIYSYQDNIVAPQDSAKLPMAENLPLRGVGHLEMAFSPQVAELVVQKVRFWRSAASGG